MKRAKKNFELPIRENRTLASGNHSALVRGDDGNLHIRHFPTAADAARVAAEREIAGRSIKGGLLSFKLARDLGVHPKTIRRRWERGELPGVEHGERTLVIPHEACRLVKIYGLVGYARMRAAGKL